MRNARKNDLAGSVSLLLTILALAVGSTGAQDAEPTMRELMGINGHTVNFRPALYSPAVLQVRDYHNLSWDIGGSTSNDTQFPFAANQVNWKTMYESWQDYGFTIDASIQFTNIDQSEWDNVAADAYKYGKAFASYFGATSGQGLVTSVEIGNEPGFYADSFYRTLYQNMARGIRDGDPAMKIVTCNATVGVSDTYARSLSCLDGMMDLIDVISVHSYPHLTGWPTWEPSYPEDPRLAYLQRVQDIIDWRDQNAPDKEVWVTEFGYDSTTQPNYTSGTFKDWMHVNDTQQAQYLTRSYLAFSEMDVDKAYMYFFNDSDTPSLHAASGLTRNYVPKPSYWAISHLQETLGDYRLAEVIQKSVGDLHVYAYQKADSEHDQIWVLWSPTGEDREVVVTLDLMGAEVRWAERMPLVEGDAPLVPYELLPDGSIRLAVGESPTYLAVTMPEPASTSLLLLGAVALLRRRR